MNCLYKMLIDNTHAITIDNKIATAATNGSVILWDLHMSTRYKQGSHNCYVIPLCVCVPLCFS